jgi:hypothetical protein
LKKRKRSMDRIRRWIRKQGQLNKYNRLHTLLLLLLQFSKCCPLCIFLCKYLLSNIVENPQCRLMCRVCKHH